MYIVIVLIFLTVIGIVIYFKKSNGNNSILGISLPGGQSKKAPRLLSTSSKAIKFIKSHEGFRAKAYDDANPHRDIVLTNQVEGYLTIGYGHTKNVQVGQVISEAEAERLLAQDLREFERIVQNKVNVDLTQNQFDALVSHAFNTGGSDTLFKLVNGAERINFKGIMYDLGKWWTEKYTTSKGVPMNGLVRRRREEFELYNA